MLLYVCLGLFVLSALCVAFVLLVLILCSACCFLCCFMFLGLFCVAVPFYGFKTFNVPKTSVPSMLSVLIPFVVLLDIDIDSGSRHYHKMRSAVVGNYGALWVSHGPRGHHCRTQWGYNSTTTASWLRCVDIPTHHRKMTCYFDACTLTFEHFHHANCPSPPAQENPHDCKDV